LSFYQEPYSLSGMGIPFRESACPLEAALDVVGDRWSLLILRDAFYGVRRFEGFRRHLGISRKVLSQRLSRLVDAGVLRRVRVAAGAGRHEYRLTPKGGDLFPVLLAMMRWGELWTGGQDWLRLVHLDCGCDARGRMVCEACGRSLRLGRVRALPGKDVPPEAVRALRRAVRAGRRKGA